MGHRFKKPSPSTRMYRHFAVITVVATGLLAFFADGERAKAVSHAVEEQQQQQELRRESKARLAEKGPVQLAESSWGREVDVFNRQAFGGNSIGFDTSIFSRDLVGLGYPPDYLARLSPDERDALAAAVAVNTGGSQGPMSSQAASLEAESRFRSGSAGRE